MRDFPRYSDIPRGRDVPVGKDVDTDTHTSDTETPVDVALERFKSGGGLRFKCGSPDVFFEGVRRARSSTHGLGDLTRMEAPEHSDPPTFLCPPLPDPNEVAHTDFILQRATRPTVGDFVRAAALQGVALAALDGSAIRVVSAAEIDLGIHTCGLTGEPLYTPAPANLYLLVSTPLNHPEGRQTSETAPLGVEVDAWDSEGKLGGDPLSGVPLTSPPMPADLSYRAWYESLPEGPDIPSPDTTPGTGQGDPFPDWSSAYLFKLPELDAPEDPEQAD